VSEHTTIAIQAVNGMANGIEIVDTDGNRYRIDAADAIDLSKWIVFNGNILRLMAGHDYVMGKPSRFLMPHHPNEVQP